MNAPDSPEAAVEQRDTVEEALSLAVSGAVKEWLGMYRSECLRASRGGVSLTASASGYPALGEALGWWSTLVNNRVLSAVRRIFKRVWDGPKDYSTSLDAAETFIGRVSDRLVQGLEPSLPVDAMDRVRLDVAASIAEGWTSRDLTERLGATLAWEKNDGYWRRERERLAARLDERLDPLGPPGTPAREAARLSDPVVSALQREHARATLQIDAEQSHWQSRAEKIARTESTAAYAYGALCALHEEGWTHKEWSSTGADGRTRPSHLAADGQVVPIGEPFNVGGFLLQMPGDPSGPAREVIRCRCTIYGSDG